MKFLLFFRQRTWNRWFSPFVTPHFKIKTRWPWGSPTGKMAHFCFLKGPRSSHQRREAYIRSQPFCCVTSVQKKEKKSKMVHIVLIHARSWWNVSLSCPLASLRVQAVRGGAWCPTAGQSLPPLLFKYGPPEPRSAPRAAGFRFTVRGFSRRRVGETRCDVRRDTPALPV